MQITVVEGIVVDADTGVGLPDLNVVVYDVASLTRPRTLEKTRTKTNGSFNLSYTSAWVPSVQVRVLNDVKRVIGQSEVYPDVTDTFLDVQSIPIAELDRTGLAVTLLKGQPQMASRGCAVAFDIDNELAWQRITTAVGNATESVSIAQLLFDVTNLFTTFNDIPQAGVPFPGGTRLEEELLRINRDIGVAVRILLCKFHARPALPKYDWLADWLITNAQGVADYFEDQKDISAHTIEVLFSEVLLNAAMHAKLFVVDRTEAYINASPLLQEYFDGNEHLYDDPRRGTMKLLGSVIKTPIHDVSVAIRGPAVADLYRTFYLMWRSEAENDDAIDGTTLPEPLTVPPVATSTEPGFHPAAIQIVRTLPGKRFMGQSPGGDSSPVVGSVPAAPDGEAGILEAYLRAFDAAQDFIYLENQYFTERAITDSLVIAMNRRPQLQLIVVINVCVDAPPYWIWQTRRIRELREHIDNAEDRFKSFTVWTHGTSDGESVIIPTYIHSKVGIVDDLWATVGSANLDGQGLKYSQHVEGIVVGDWDLEMRAQELNVVITSDTDDPVEAPAVVDLRQRIWAEHLGLQPADLDAVNLPADGWLSLWRKRAAAKVEYLKTGAAPGIDPEEAERIRVLPTPSNYRARPFKRVWLEHYLESLGIPDEKVEELGVRREVRSFSFTDSSWD